MLFFKNITGCIRCLNKLIPALDLYSLFKVPVLVTPAITEDFDGFGVGFVVELPKMKYHKRRKRKNIMVNFNQLLKKGSINDAPN